jgi:hypothetical protein
MASGDKNPKKDSGKGMIWKKRKIKRIKKAKLRLVPGN